MTRNLNAARVTQGWAVQILLLTWADGSMDALGYLGLEHVFTANMTGNTVLLGLAAGRGQLLAALRSLSALLGFLAGVAIGAVAIQRQKPASSIKRAISRAVLVEGVVLLLFTLLWHLPADATGPAAVLVLTALAAIAMGIQSAVVRRMNLPGIATTYITGTITSLAGLTNRLIRAQALSRSTGIAGRATMRGHRVQLQAGVFLVYGIAAVMSGVFQMRVPALVAFSPLGAIVLVFVLTQRLGAGEEPAAG